MATWTVTACNGRMSLAGVPELLLTVRIVEDVGTVSDTFDMTAKAGTEVEVRARVCEVVAERRTRATAAAMVGLTGVVS